MMQQNLTDVWLDKIIEDLFHILVVHGGLGHKNIRVRSGGQFSNVGGYYFRMIDGVIGGNTHEVFAFCHFGGNVQVLDGSHVLRIVIDAPGGNVLTGVFFNIRPNFFFREVSGAVIGNDQFNIGIILLKFGVQRLIDIPKVPVAAQYDGYLRFHFFCLTFSAAALLRRNGGTITPKQRWHTALNQESWLQERSARQPSGLCCPMEIDGLRIASLIPARQ